MWVSLRISSELAGADQAQMFAILVVVILLLISPGKDIWHVMKDGKIQQYPNYLPDQLIVLGRVSSRQLP